MVAMLLDSRKILRMVSWDISRPFRLIRFSPIFNTPFGESVPDLLGRLNEELNTLHNQRVDAVTINNIPFGFFDPASGFDPEKMEMAPGVFYPTNGRPSDAVYFPPSQPVKPEMYREEELLLTYAERLLGAGANVQGGAQPRRTSATEIATIDRRTGIRFFTIFKRIQEGLEEVGKLVLELDQKFMPPIKQIRVMGANDYPLFERRVTFDSIQKDEMQGKFDVVAVGESLADQEANKQEQLAIYQLGTSNPLIAMDPESLYELTKDTLMALGDKNIGAHLKKPQVSVPQNPEDEHNRMAQGERVDPVQGENYDYHLAKHGEFINSPQFLLIPEGAQIEVMRHYQNTIRVKQLHMQLLQLQQQQMMVQSKAQQEQQESSLDRQAARDSAVKANGNKSE